MTSCIPLMVTAKAFAPVDPMFVSIIRPIKVVVLWVIKRVCWALFPFASDWAWLLSSYRMQKMRNARRYKG